MDLKAFFESFKEYFMDIVGFIIPGITLFLGLSYCLNSIYFMKLPFLNYYPEYFNFLFLALNYVLGYLVYGFGISKDFLIDKIKKIQSSTTQIEHEVKNTPAFKKAFEKYNIYLISKSLTPLLESDITCRELRSKVMSHLSDIDNKKIYRFMYQSDLTKHVGNVLLFLGSFGLINYVLSYWSININLFNHEKLFIFYYIIFILCYILFRSSRRYFYDKALRTPFNMYMAI